jgi:hypothetical protein
MISRVLGMAKATVAEHYIFYLAEQRYGLRPPGRPRRLRRTVEGGSVEAVLKLHSKTAFFGLGRLREAARRFRTFPNKNGRLCTRI